MTWISEQYADLLKDETKAFACLATLMKDGSPQLTPIWFNTDGKFIYLNSAVGRVKDLNMRRDRRIALVILDPNNSYRYIQIRGRILEITSQGARAHIDALAKKYHGIDKYTSGPAGEIRVMYKFLPEKISER
jgi:PPOX class probable F420-dependent enzyme